VKIILVRMLCSICLCALSQSGFADTELLFAQDATSLTPSAESWADKARVQNLANGTLVVVWHQAAGAPDGAWDLSGITYAPRDIFMRTSVDNGDSWSDALNVSNTAGLTDPAALYDRLGDGSGVANFFGDSDKATVMASGNNLLITWNDSYCGDGRHGPARYEGAVGLIERPYRCLYVARVTVSSGITKIISIDRLTDATRDVANEVARATGAGFALAWQEDPAGLQLGEALGEGEGASGARTTPGTDIWYAWISQSNFTNVSSKWQGPMPISNNFDYATATAISGGASRPIMALAGSPPAAILVYEEAKNNGPVDIGKNVIFHQFVFNSPPPPAAGTIISAPAENSRRARIVAMATPGETGGTRMVLMWRQGMGHQGAPADFMMRIGAVPAGTDLVAVPHAGFRLEDIWPPVDPSDPANNAPGLNLSSAQLDDATAADPFANTKAHRAVLDGDFIFAGYTQDSDVNDGLDHYRYLVRWSADGGKNWSEPAQVSGGELGFQNVIEPRLVRTPGTIASGRPEDIHNPDAFLFAWGTEVMAADGSAALPDALFVTRSMDRGATFERVQALEASRTAPEQTDEQIQLIMSPDGQNVAAVWIRRDLSRSDVIFSTAVGITPTADTSVTMSATDMAPDVGDTLRVTLEIGNAGPQMATELRVTAALDAGLSLLSMATPAGTCDAAPVPSCLLDDLVPGATITVELELLAVDRGQQSVTAEVVAREADPELLNNVAQLPVEVVPNADLSVSVLALDEQIATGEIFGFRYQITNHGPQLASNIRLTVSLPGILLSSRDDALCQTLEGVLVCPVSDLAGGESSSGILHFDALRTGAAFITIIANATENDPIADNNAASVRIEIIGEGGGGGCVYDPDGSSDSTLLLLLLLGLGRSVAKKCGVKRYYTRTV